METSNKGGHEVSTQEVSEPTARIAKVAAELKGLVATEVESTDVKADPERSVVLRALSRSVDDVVYVIGHLPD